jgi:glycerol-3-phosphate dehydrogenase
MVRDLRRLADTTFDLVVVGAGIYGAIAAWDASQRGLSVALIDRGDFGAGTSFNSLKTLHGGLRSLQSLDLRQMRLFIRERRTFARIAPHLVRVLPCVVPTYRDWRRNAAVMQLALAVSDLMARDRNEGLDDPRTHLPASHLVSRRECLELSPAIDPEGVTGGALWHDYQMPNADRMTLAFVLAAAAGGVSVANHVAAARLIPRGSRVEGVHAEDGLTGQPFDLRAKVVLNAAGPWAPALVKTAPAGGRTPLPSWSRAMNLVTRPFLGTHACGGVAGGRFIFAVPWRHVSIVGTSHSTHEGGPDMALTRSHVEGLLHEAREAFPGAKLAMDDVRLVHRGLLPARNSSARGDVALLRESLVTGHRAQGVQGLVSMIGVRYTTARQTAADAVDAVFHALGYPLPPACRTDRTVLAGGQHPPRGQGAQQALAPESTATEEDLRHAIREEAALRLSDAVIRRTDLGSAGHPGREALARAAQVMAAELRWTDARMRDEIADVEAFYRMPE